MKKKGFTLIELLAVIVILAIIALITTPVVLGVIERARKGVAENSAYGYIDAVEKYIMTNSMDMSKKDINNGTYKDNELGVDYKGKGPDNALITVEKGIVKEAKLCINKYSFDYDGEKVTNSINNYCSNNYKIKLVIDDNIEEKSIEKETNTTFEIGDITNKTNIVCNNGAVPTLENNILTIFNIFGDTTCKINNSLEDTINNIDNTENSIIMINDETKNIRIDIGSDKNIVLNLNGKTIETINPDDLEDNSTENDDKYASFYVYGKLTINDKENKGWIISPKSANNIYVTGSTGELIINGGNYNGYRAIVNCGSFLLINDGKYFSKKSDVINQYSSAKTIINGGYFKQDNSTLYYSHSGILEINSGIFESNRLVINNIFSVININGGSFISNGSSSLLNNSLGTININQIDKPIYITSLAQKWAPAISNSSTGSINIKANQADNCTDNIEDTTSGLCVYAEGNGDETSLNGNGAIQNVSSGIINVNGGTYFGTNTGINNNSNGNISVSNAEVLSQRYNIINMGEGTVDVLSSKIYLANYALTNGSTGSINVCNSLVNSTIYDLKNTSTGTINYSKNVIFTNGTNTPNVYNPSGTINANYTGTCLIK